MTLPTPTMTPGEPSARLTVAARELRAAQAIVLDPSCEDSLAATHLAIAWQALALATWPEGQANSSAAPGAPATWPEGQAQGDEAPAGSPATWPEGQAQGDEAPAGSPATSPQGQVLRGPRPEDRAALPPALAAAIDPVLPALLAAQGRSPFDPTPWSVPHALLERHCDALARILARHHAPGRAGQPWRRRAALGVGLLALLVVALRPWQAESLGPWAGTYFNRADFSGTSSTRRDLDLRFDWAEKSPMDSLPADRFSVRWQTCLDVPTAMSVPFQLVSDDGSRLYLDDKLVLDNWNKHTVEARGVTLELTPGEHHLRVDYFEHTNNASVALLASFDGEPPASIPRGMLRAPGDDEEAPCGE